MSGDNEDWTDLQAVWRAGSAPADAGLAERLRTRVRRERLRSRGEAIAEAVVCAFCTGVFLWWAAGASGGSRLLFIALAAVTAASFLVTSALRHAVWRAQGQTVAAYQRLLRRRSKLGLAFARIGYVGAPVGVLSGLLIAQVVETGSIAAAPALTDAVAVVAVLALVAGWLWSIREAGRHMRILQALEDQEA